MSHQSPSVQVIKPDFSLQQEIGKNLDLEKTLSAEKVEQAVAFVAEEKKEYIEEALEKLKEMNLLFRKLLSAPEDNETAIEKIRFIALDIKGKAGMFDYGLVTEISDSLHKFLAKKPIFSEEMRIIIRAHLDAIHAVFSQNIKGESHTMAQALIKEFKAISSS